MQIATTINFSRCYKAAFGITGNVDGAYIRVCSFQKPHKQTHFLANFHALELIHAHVFVRYFKVEKMGFKRTFQIVISLIIQSDF